MRPVGHETGRAQGRDACLAALRERIADPAAGRPGRGREGPQALAFGIEAIDRHLPGGGLRLGALHEVVESGPMDAQAALFVAGLSARLSARLPGPVLWCLSGDPHRPGPFAPGLAAVGLHPDRVIYVLARREADTLAAMEDALSHRGPVCVVGEVGEVGLTASRRLQLRAEEGGRLAVVIRRRSRQAAGRAAACRPCPAATRADASGSDPEEPPDDAGAEPSAALTRWRVRPVRSAPLAALLAAPVALPGLERARWRIELVRVRGGAPRAWIVEAPDAKGRLHLPADLADRSAAPAERRAAAG